MITLAVNSRFLRMIFGKSIMDETKFKTKINNTKHQLLLAFVCNYTQIVNSKLGMVKQETN